MIARELTTCSLLRRFCATAAVLVVTIGAARTAPAQGTNYIATVLADNPVVYYPLQELPGATNAIDFSTNGLNAWIDTNDIGYPDPGLPGIDTNAYDFYINPATGSAGEVQLPASNWFSPTNSDGKTGAPCSMDCWVMASTLANGDSDAGVEMAGPYGS